MREEPSTISRGSLLLERGREIAQLESAVERVARGESALVVVEGTPGIGKTALMRKLTRLASDAGLRVLTARGAIMEQDLAWSVTRQLLTDPVIEADADERLELLQGAAGLARRVLGLEVEDPREQVELSGALHGLYWLTINLAQRRPVLLSVDDVQWCDRQSLSYLNYLANRLDDAPMLLAVAVRTGEPEASTEAVEALRTVRATTAVRPTALTEAASAQLVRQLIAERATAEVCANVYAAAKGNPFLVRELCRELEQLERLDRPIMLERMVTAVPQRVTQSVLARLGRLPPLATMIAESVATLGASATLPRITQLARADLDDAATSVSLLLGTEVLVERDQALEFVHPLVREAVYGSIGAPRRAALHARAAGLLAQEHAGADEVATQLLRAPPAAEEWRIQALRAAADAARHAGAPETAARYLHRALAEPPPVDRRPLLLFELASTELQHDPTAAIEHVEEARRLSSSPAQSAELALVLAQAHALLSDFSSAVGVLVQARRDLPPEQHALRRRLESQTLTFARWDYGSQALRRELFAALRARAVAGDELDPRERGNLAHELTTRGEDREQAVTHAKAALERMGSVRGPEAMGLVQLTSVLVIADLPEAAQSVLSEAVASAQARGSNVEAAVALTLTTHCALRQGKLMQAIGYAQASLALAPGIWSIGAIAWLVEALAERGDHDDAERLLASHGFAEAPGEVNPEEPIGFQHAVLLHQRARARALGSQHERALADLQIVGELGEAWEVRNPSSLDWRSSAARSMLALGRAQDGAALAQEELVLARRWGAPTAIGVALCVAGECDPGSEGTALIREAVEVLAGAPALLERGRALVALGMRLRRERQNVEARDVLRRGLDLAHQCGAALLANRARDELVASGGKPRRDAVSGHAALTGRERRVTELAAAGQTNREIAQSLFLSPRTVEHHLRNAYRKLGITSREELVSALGGGEPGAGGPS